MGLFGSVTDKLFKAAGAGDAACVARYAARGADVNACNAYGRTPLTVAVFRPPTEPLVLATVAALLVRGADVNQRDSNGNTALCFACWKGYATVVEKLLAAGTQPNIANNEGTTPLIWAATLGHTTIVRWLLAAGASVDLAGPGGKTALHCAAAKGHSEIAQVLLAAGANALALSDAGRTSIASAERASDQRMAQLLRSSSLSSGSFRSTMSLSDTMGATSLSSDDAGASAIQEDVAAAIAAVEEQEQEQETEQEEQEQVEPNQELLEAADAGELARVTASLARGADINTVDTSSATPLLLAARRGHGDVVEALLLAESDVNAVDHHGDTALLVAAREGHAGIVAVLLVAGTNIHHANQRGDTAASVAVTRNHVDVLRELVGNDASLLVSVTDGNTSPRPSLLHCAAAAATRTDLNSNIDNDVDGDDRAVPTGVVAFLIRECGVDVDAVDSNGVSALELAVAADHHAMVGTLLGHGARVDQQVYKAATSPSMQATLLRHNHALYNARCVALLHGSGTETPTAIADLVPLVPLITSVYDVRWLLTLVALCPTDDGRAELLHNAFDHILAMKLVFDTPACAYFKMMLESCTESQWLPRLDVLNLDRQAENINTESAAWVAELKRQVQANTWRLDAHEQCLRQVVDGVRDVYAMVVENRRAVRSTIEQVAAVQAQVVTARQLHAQLARHTSQVVEELHSRLALCEENVVHVAMCLQTFRDAVVDRQEQEDRRRKMKMLCSVVASVAGFVLAPVVKEIADAVVDLANPIEIVQYVYGEADIARFLADQSSKRLPLKIQEQLTAFEITTDEFEALLREEIVLKHPELIAECDARKLCVDELDGGRAETARVLAPTLENERTVVLEITAELRVALSIVEQQQGATSYQKWRSQSLDMDDATLQAAYQADKTESSVDNSAVGNGGGSNERELVVFVDDASAFPFHAAVQQSRGDVTTFAGLVDALQETTPDADANAEMRLRLCCVATWREQLCAAQYAYCLGHRDVGDLLAELMDPAPTFSTTAAAMAVDLVGETDHVPYIDFVHESQGDAARCEHYLALVDADEHPLDATVAADVVRVVRSSSVAWSPVRYASHLGYVDVVKQLIRAHGKQLPVKERMSLLNHALAQKSNGSVAAHAG